MPPAAIFCCSALAAYLLGSIPFGFVVARLRGIDIREHGSGNIGATNVFRCVGKGLGIVTLVLDAVKGFAPAFVFPLLFTDVLTPPQAQALGVTGACAAVAGHNWPVFLKFKGGKGIATSAGALLGIAPAAIGVGALCWFVMLVLTRYVSVASITAAAALPVYGWLAYRKVGLLLPIALTVLGVVAIWRHRANIARLMNGEENRFSLGRKTKGEAT